MQNLPQGFQSTFTDCGEVRLHVVHNAAATNPDGSLDDPRRPLIFLHGFPEFWAGWRPVMEALGEKYLVLAPDQRGYNLSDAPQKVADYTVKKLVSDILALSSNLLGSRKFVAAGHDWGASVAYGLAFGVPERLAGLAIVNGVHPLVFQRALIEDTRQAEASQYIHYLRSPEAGERLAQDGFRRTFGMFEKFSAAPWLDEGWREQYRQAWSQPGRLNGMLNWYRASPMVIPVSGEATPDAPLLGTDRDRFVVKAPHLLIWGQKDVALQTASREGLERFAPRLEVVEIEDGDHWVIHTHGKQIASEIDRFVSALPA